jgi:hypothetical protein
LLLKVAAHPGLAAGEPVRVIDEDAIEEPFAGVVHEAVKGWTVDHRPGVGVIQVFLIDGDTLGLYPFMELEELGIDTLFLLLPVTADAGIERGLLGVRLLGGHQEGPLPGRARRVVYPLHNGVTGRRRGAWYTGMRCSPLARLERQEAGSC